MGDAAIVQSGDRIGGETVQHSRDLDLTALAGLPGANVLRVIEDCASKLA
jgi:hypothetical protein